MRILIAPDKFKGSLGAAAVGAQIAEGLRAVLPQAALEIVPVADGGEGTAEVICRARDGERVECRAHDALGRSLRTQYVWLAAADQAVLEMSAAAGWEQLAPNERDPLRASTFGVGEILRDAAMRRAKQILLGLGGSTTNDGGSGLARALGFRFLDAQGGEITAAGELRNLSRIEKPNELALPPIVAMSDVRNPLLGPHGATRVFGPQKGATPAQIEILEQALTRLADVAAETFGCTHRDAPGAGAAGGLGFGLLT
ncbi:MAG: glycerate kinase, partial [Rhodanobacteraceae bacterium]